MSRAPAPADTISVKPSMNIYGILVIVACLVQALGLMVMYFRYSSLFDKAH